MPTTGAPIVGPSSSFDKTDWYKTSPAFLNGKKNLYLSWSSKSDVSDSNNSVGGVGQVGASAAIYYRHNTNNSAAPAAWLIGYTFSDRKVEYRSPANSGANNKLQRVAFQIQSGAAPQMWIDGVLQTPNAIIQEPTGAGYPTGGLIIQAADELWIGRAVHGLWDGLLDEFRIIEQTVDTNYALTEFRNLNNIDDFVVFGDTETPSSALSPRGELVLAETNPGTKVRIKVDSLIVNPNPSSVVLSAVSTPTSGTAVKVDDAYVDFTPTSAVGTSRFTVTFTSGGKSVTVPVVVNVSGTVSLRPPDITDISLLPDRVSWNYTEPAGFEGYQPKEGPDGATWATATNVGARTTNKYVMKAGLLVPSKKVLVKPYANGLEALNAAEISLVEVPVTPGQYYSSPNYGTKTRDDVGSHEELMNAIAGINPANAYINMTYTDSTATAISRGGTATHPLIITAQAPNGLDNFSGRAGFTNSVTVTGDYVWLDRLSCKINGNGSAAVNFKGSWKFITRCLVDAARGVSMADNVNANEWWIGFNRFIGATVANDGHVEINVAKTSATPKNGRIYYNVFQGTGGSGDSHGYAIFCEPGAKSGVPDQEYAGVNVPGSWAHYNYVDVSRWGFYLKHGVDCSYNHIQRCNYHSISTRGESVSNVSVKYNRLIGGSQSAFQGWHMNIIGNYVRSNDGLLISCEYRLTSSTKITRAARHSVVAGNDAEMTVGECRDGSSLVVLAPLKDCSIEKHTGKYYRWISDSSRAEITPDSSGKFPTSPTYRGNPLYDRNTVLVKPTTSQPLQTPPTLNATICGPGSDRGKVWGT